MAALIVEEEGKLNISWSSTSPTSGRFVPTERAGVAGLMERFGELRAQGRGYLEVSSNAGFPVLTLGFKGSAAVIHLMSGEEAMSLLVADEPANADAEVLVIDDLVEFSAEFVFDLDRAWQIVEDFVRTGDPVRAGEWCEL